MFKVVFLVVAAVCFGLKALNVNLAGIDLMNLGFMFVVISVLV